MCIVFFNLKEANSSFLKRITYFRSICANNVMKPDVFIFEHSSSIMLRLDRHLGPYFIYLSSKGSIEPA